MAEPEQKRTEPASKSYLDLLPPEVLLLIFSRLEQEELKPITLVSKSLLPVSSTLVHHLTFRNSIPDDNTFVRLFNRFPNINAITFDYCFLDGSLTAVKTSKWSLEALEFRRFRASYPDEQAMLNLSGSDSCFKKVESLVLEPYSIECKSDEILDVMKLFPLVSELEVCTTGYSVKSWNDDRIEKLVLMFPDLRKLRLKGSTNVSDRALVVLAANCVHLEQLSVQGCDQMTPHGLCTFLREHANLRSLDVPRFPSFASQTLFIDLAETISLSAWNLNHLSIVDEMVSDVVLEVGLDWVFGRGG